MDEFIEECLGEHNVKRALHGTPPLKPSRSLDKTAQDWAEQLITEESIKNSPLSGQGEVGESISMRTSTSSHVDIQGSEVVNQWYADIKNYNFESNKGPAGNFTQLVWKSTREVGFGKARAAGKCIVVAHYRPPGNVRGRYSENVPPPLDGKLSSSASNDKQDLDAKRSVVTETVTEPDGRTYTVQREIVETTEADGRVKRCVNETYHDTTKSTFDRPATKPGSPSPDSDSRKPSEVNSAVQISQREEFVNSVVRAHNVYRQLHGASELKLDPQLCQMAQDWADQLVSQPYLSNSGSTYHGIRLGENVFSRWSNASALVTGQEVIDHWYQESSKYKFNTEPASIQGIGGFTQMIWASSQRLGVGIATQLKKDTRGAGDGPGTQAPTKFVVVCHYYPPGNVTGQFKNNVKPILK
ncbi:hypothetical protein P879_02275 [Paragonimus westermani]|uniref:SCP domain-containing protein n=1 Tax=Paragonimus westermani TaxID=34504 RepID=A0A8T0DJW7_9TREM|nr:hypothetical protein P879_02275 [Paragonimus westermani]